MRGNGVVIFVVQLRLQFFLFVMWRDVAARLIFCNVVVVVLFSPSLSLFYYFSCFLELITLLVFSFFDFGRESESTRGESVQSSCHDRRQYV